jgi:hypothetical protein
MNRPGKKIVCRVRVEDQARSVEFTWSEGSASFKPYALEREQLDDFRGYAQAARDKLLDLVRHHEAPVGERDPDAERQAGFDLAQSGTTSTT